MRPEIKLWLVIFVGASALCSCTLMRHDPDKHLITSLVQSLGMRGRITVLSGESGRGYLYEEGVLKNEISQGEFLDKVTEGAEKTLYLSYMAPGVYTFSLGGRRYFYNAKCKRVVENLYMPLIDPPVWIDL